MELNIQAIINDKLEEMQQSGEIQSYIKSNVAKMMQEAINDIFDYTLESEIRKALSEQVNQSFKKIDFTSYNGFILQAVNSAIDGIAKKDFQEKLTEQLSTIFFQKREKVKLSELFEKYRECIIAETSNKEKDRLGKFYAKMKHQDEYGWIEISLGREAEEYRVTISIANFGGKEGDILSACDRIMGRDICHSLPIKYPNSFEVYLMNLCYNNTPIEIDVESINEVDTSLLPF